MLRCSLCSKTSVIAELSREELCMGCICDFREGLPEEDMEEDMEGVGVCLNCRKETILFRGLLCWACFKREVDDFQRDEERQDYNCRL